MEEYLELFVEETSWYNELVLNSTLPKKLWTPLPPICRGWLRNYIGCTFVYLLTGSLYCFYIYYLKQNIYMPKGAIPSKKAMLLQIGVSMKSIPWYCVVPTISEYMVEQGWTKCFPRISNVGWPAYFYYLILYLAILELGMYWIHRKLHEVKPLYKYLHSIHHIYNKKSTVSPFAGMALHPLDGILQATPHIIALFLVPMHFTTHVALIFIEVLWTTNIHDCIHGNVWPIMGGGYHAIHHTTFRDNYGHYTIMMDWMFGTIQHPVKNKNKTT